MATVNKRFLKNATRHSNFAKRCKNSNIRKVIDVTGVQEYLREDWEELVELNPEYLQPKMLYDQLIYEELTTNEWREKYKETDYGEAWSFFYQMMLAARREQTRLSIMSRRLFNKKRRLLEVKDSLQKEIEMYKAKLGFIPCSSK